MEKNEPLLADVRAPWDGAGKWSLLRPRLVWKTILYNCRYGWYWAPVSMDPWRYRRFLSDLDEVCLRSLRSHGALTARDLADWLNRELLLRTKPEKTGIHRITLITARDWLDLANRHGLVTVWTDPSGRADSSRNLWQLTEKGQEAVRSKLLAFLDRFYPLMLALIAGGLLLGAVRWLTVHPGILVWGVLLGIEITALAVFTVRSERRETPGIAVVAIETLRSAGRPIPAL